VTEKSIELSIGRSMPVSVDSQAVAGGLPPGRSPAPSRPIRRASCFRSDFAPLIFSWKISVQPAAFSSVT
jgi:hypothetical protein